MRRTRSVLLEAVVVPVAELVDPGHRRLGVREVSAQQRRVGAPVVQVRQHDDEQARRVMRPVVRLVRQDLQLGELAVPDLVRDLARFHVAFRVVLGRLQLRQPAQRPAGELREARDALHRHDQRVATEQRHEPRHAGSRDEDAALERGVLELERLQVANGLVPGSIHDRVGGLDADVREVLGADLAQRRVDRVAVERDEPPARAGNGQPFQAGVPDVLGRDRRDEHQAPVGELGGR